MHIVPRDEHNVSRRDISQSALKVMKRLHEGNYQAYLVGGGVRDVLLGGKPKDFDVATNATPEQVKRLFRNSRIIGRRFRIVHVRFGREVIEVTTFRASHEEAKNRKEAQQNESGMLLRDNVYGDIHSDAMRRDFTVNALYYTNEDFCIYDYTGGLKDIEHRQIRMIGEPTVRFQEDPVRLLRAVRFAAKLDFTIEPNTAQPIPELGHLLNDIPSARLWDESLKLFMSGHALSTYLGLCQYNLFQYLFPGSAEHIDSHPIAKEFFRRAMVNTDRRIQADKRVTPAFIFAVLMWPEVQHTQKQLEQEGNTPSQALQQASQQVISRQLTRISIPKRFTMTVRDIWDLQLRLPKRAGHRALRTFEHPKFRAAYDFLLLREESGEETNGLAQWWTEYQNADEVSREKMANDQHGKGKSRRAPRRRSRKRKPSGSHTHSEQSSENP
ncbi:polynucleotide adenylyltransferase PcnB [Marinibactrum halimedae]|uniref:Poly(A) polymerase I n=2 Tax=Marinibactrum halimedae TaxID=1444977 RepID=A0AA37T8F9_9GAMM|nr:polynucleotide adenylyltransferase PcnB [Marinibactrum halimedae]MCD9458992.1 polynucleotide adenylyltransferase PcnB [Marinibactrum halimedae]GLS26878.1 poly(A) polymerase I [Marinibactrum halimedae]